MKTPAEYVTDAWQPDPDPWPVGGLPLVPLAQAEAAVAAALSDAEKYRTLLARAVRHATPQPQAASEGTLPHVTAA